MNYGVIIGRFQSDGLTPAHSYLINQVIEKHGKERTIILVGTRETPPTDRNPLSWTHRANIIQQRFGVSVLPIWDCVTNQEWSKNVDSMITSVIGLNSAILYHGRDSFAPCYTGKFKLQEVNFPESVKNVSSTARRKEVGNTIMDSQYFYMGIIHAMQNLPPRIYSTVDIAAIYVPGTLAQIHGAEAEILLGKKEGGTGWILPGGFINVGEDPKDAARRELSEETGCYLETIECIDAFVIDDWRTRGESTVSNMTILYTGITLSKMVKANDDLTTIRQRAEVK